MRDDGVEFKTGIRLGGNGIRRRSSWAGMDVGDAEFGIVLFPE